MSSTSEAERTARREVLVLSRLQLMSQTVAAALGGRGIDAQNGAWAAGVHRATHDLTSDDTVLLLDDLEDRDSVLATQDLVAQSPARFVVLTNCTEGPAWGALLVSGAMAILPTESSLEAVGATVNLVRSGRSPVTAARRDHLVEVWTDWLAEDDDSRARMSQLSGRERTVLDLLSRGFRVTEIGAELGTAEATVRSQIKSMRRKLGVDSQLAAVAIAHRLGGVPRGGSAPALPRPRQPED